VLLLLLLLLSLLLLPSFQYLLVRLLLVKLPFNERVQLVPLLLLLLLVPLLLVLPLPDEVVLLLLLLVVLSVIVGLLCDTDEVVARPAVVSGEASEALPMQFSEIETF